MRQAQGFCGKGDEPSGSIKCLEFSNTLKNAKFSRTFVLCGFSWLIGLLDSWLANESVSQSVS
jgi:hypothetical protein